MSGYRTPAQNRAVAAGELIIALASLVTAVVLHPIGEWSVLDIVGGIIVAGLAVYAAYLLLTGKSDSGISERGFARPRRQRTFSLLAIAVFVIAAVLIAISNAGGSWTANDVLFIGVWAFLTVVMASYVGVANAQLKRDA